MILSSAYYREGQYLFGRIEERIKEAERRLSRKVIRLSLGDVTCPVAPCVAYAMEVASREMVRGETFRGYPPSTGFPFVKEAIAKTYRGLVNPDEIFVSDGAKSDLAGWAYLFDKSLPALIPDPSYPVYRDSSRLVGREIVALPCTQDNDFVPTIPSFEGRSLIYLCSPANPTARTMTMKELQEWVDYAIKTNSIILFDAAYQAFALEGPRSIYEIEGAKECAIEIGSLSKSASFGGLRFGWSIVPAQLQVDGIKLANVWRRRQSTLFNGVSYVTQRGAEAALSKEGLQYSAQCVEKYRQNTHYMASQLALYTSVQYGDAPYVWVKVSTNGVDVFERLLEMGVSVTPGEGFGKEGYQYIRLSGFAKREDIEHSLTILSTLTQNL